METTVSQMKGGVEVRKVFFLGLVVGMVLSLSTVAHAANSLNNADFEAWGPYGPGGSEVAADWWDMGAATVTRAKESTIIQGGSYSAKDTISGTGWGGWGQWAAVTGGQTLYAHQPVNIPTALVNAEAVLEIKFRDAANENTVLGTQVVTRSTATNGWESLDFSGVAPAGTGKASYTVLLRDKGSNGSGSVYFDNSYADTQPIPEPASLLLLGSGLMGLFGVSRKK